MRVREVEEWHHGVAPVESLWTLPGRRSRKRFAEGDRVASALLFLRHPDVPFAPWKRLVGCGILVETYDLGT